jgi:hypothetical protein
MIYYYFDGQSRSDEGFFAVLIPVHSVCYGWAAQSPEMRDYGNSPHFVIPFLDINSESSSIAVSTDPSLRRG